MTNPTGRQKVCDNCFNDGLYCQKCCETQEYLPPDRQKAIEAAMRSPQWESQVATAAKNAEADAVDASVDFSPMNFERGFIDGFKAGADWQEAQTGWVKIADMPEEWKDGRFLDYYHPLFGRLTNSEPEILRDMKGITHAMLPPSLPKQDNRDG